MQPYFASEWTAANPPTFGRGQPDADAAIATTVNASAIPRTINRILFSFSLHKSVDAHTPAHRRELNLPCNRLDGRVNCLADGDPSRATHRSRSNRTQQQRQRNISNHNKVSLIAGYTETYFETDSTGVSTIVRTKTRRGQPIDAVAIVQSSTANAIYRTMIDSPLRESVFAGGYFTTVCTEASASVPSIGNFRGHPVDTIAAIASSIASAMKRFISGPPMFVFDNYFASETGDVVSVRGQPCAVMTVIASNTANAT